MIEVKRLTKRYGDHLAADEVSFTVKDGTVCGFLGLNGAGKSTVMNMITGYLGPTSGTASVNGHDIIEEPLEAKREIGYLPEVPPLYPDMTVGEYLDFAARLKRLSRADARAETRRVIERLGLDGVEHRLIRNLSKGYRQRAGFAQALIGNPPVLILDEPTAGLDPKQIIEFRNLVRELKGEHTVILSTHILAEVGEVCDEVLIMNAGRIVRGFSLAEIGGQGESLEEIFLEVTGEDAEDGAATAREVLGAKAGRGSGESGGETEEKTEAADGRDL